MKLRFRQNTMRLRLNQREVPGWRPASSCARNFDFLEQRCSPTVSNRTRQYARCTLRRQRNSRFSVAGGCECMGG